MKINLIKVDKFRNISGIEIKFSNSLNAIAGQNGTSKTSILGLIGHVFTFPKEHKTLSGKSFETEFSEIFKFAYPDYDKAGDHNWIVIPESGKPIPALSFDRIEKNKKLGLRIRVRESKVGSGKIKFPVIYLGMGRLFPLTLEKEINSFDSELSEEEIKHFEELHNEILLMSEDIQPEKIISSSKNFYTTKTAMYNHLGNSAGQDNIGQIITALISFKRLQISLGDKYEGGILLIDELDASLFPAAQIKLLNRLEQKSKELKLQIFFTTHSLEILSETQKKKDSTVIYLDKSHGTITPLYDLDFESIKENLLVLGPDAFKNLIIKKVVYTEDEEGKNMLKCILSKDLKDKIDIISTGLGCGELKNIAKKKIPAFKKSLIILDGDASTSNLSNIIKLPGNSGPDRIAYDFLKNLSDSDDFWKIKKGYDKQFCFKDLSSLSLDKSKDREKVKKWYLVQKKYWGREACIFWKRWCEDSVESVNNFVEKIKSKL